MGNPAVFNPNDFVRITNEGDEALEGRYAGIDYEFPIGKPVDLALPAAHHIFGFGGDEKARNNAFMRHGWIQTSADLKSAQRKLAKVRFEEVPNVLEFAPRPRISRMGPQADGGTEGAAAIPTGKLLAPDDLIALEDDEDETGLSGERI